MNRLSRFIHRSVLIPIGERLGIPMWTRTPALSNIDLKLKPYLNFRNGFFIEAGGNNGIRQSNTFFLEKGRRWRGILVEPIPELFNECERIRGASLVVNGALVSSDFPEKTIEMHYANLMSIAEGAMPEKEMNTHIESGLACQNISKSYKIKVPAITFDEILQKQAVTQIDFLSLDLEGYEIEALKGLDFTKYRPRFILLEVRNLDEADLFLVRRDYKRIERFSHHDYLYMDTKNE